MAPTKLIVSVLSLPFVLTAQPSADPWAWRTLVRGTHAVIAAEHPLQARAALRTLEAGGNAIDAAVALFYMTGVTEQHQAGIGGDAYILAYIAKLDRVVFINGTGPAPRLATPEFYKRKFNGIPPNGPFSTNVPGAVSAFELFHRSYGSKPHASLIADAIESAEKGHPLSEFAARTHAEVMPMLLRYPSSASALLKDGKPFDPGDLFV